ncbi:hypothetical protein [Bacillus sp. MZGC1]|uniref:hypothetical protein n=1 Tax=Bacillus sp. MZGC1 TaxID=2108543 RepID=UPI000D03D259|nr:hypothetical protein [Bacillus sp. MZGC1]PRS47510.1 hypothetical protein C6Y06_18335 [Bacillus sp. MZGC1]
MLKFVYRNFKNPINPFEESIREHFKKSCGITLYGLASKDKAHSLVSKFPKYTKVKPTSCTSNKSFDEEYGIYSEKLNRNGYDTHITYGIDFSMSPINNVTGDFNEAGQKRLNKFIDVLKREGYIS